MMDSEMNFPSVLIFWIPWKGGTCLQVHPLKEYIKEKFGMTYTQDESYYMLDAKDNAFVYLGLKEHTDPDTMMKDLAAAQNDNILLKPTIIAKMAGTKHDHVLFLPVRYIVQAQILLYWK
jgi:mannose-6-phosphate isomerase class I